MTKKQKERLGYIMATLGMTTGFILWVTQTFKDNMLYFVMPHQLISLLKEHKLSKHKTIRLGGLVKKESLKREGIALSFIICDDTHAEIKVIFKGIAPTLFSEGKGVIAQGQMDENIFVAETLLAKHDASYKRSFA